MSRLADLVAKGPWTRKEIDPWSMTFDEIDSGYESFIATAIGFKDAVEPMAIIPCLTEKMDDAKAAELMEVKLKLLMGIPGMVAAIRGAITVMREMQSACSSSDVVFGDARDKIAIQKLEDALRNAGLSVPLT